jgi:hypothetical protein
MSITLPNYLEGLPKPNRNPLEILREFADELPHKTGDKVRGMVSTLNPGGSTLFRYTFYLHVPSLNDYTDPLFYAWHGTDFDQVTLLFAGDQQGKDDIVCRGETELVRRVEEIFNRSDTKKRIQALIALAGH